MQMLDSIASMPRFMRLAMALVAFFALAGVPGIAAADSVQTGHVMAELVAADDALVPGTTATVALRLAIAPGCRALD